METGNCVVTRGALPTSSTEQDAPEMAGFEGEQRSRYILHRRREASVRAKKIMAVLWLHKSLKCEVPRCGFDFALTYGELGKEFAYVHHLKPLGEAPAEGRKIELNDLAIVCANCHAMIHRGGQCRPLAEVMPSR
jgi:predicted HNH restriction endonuclease